MAWYDYRASVFIGSEVYARNTLAGLVVAEAFESGDTTRWSSSSPR